MENGQKQKSGLETLRTFKSDISQYLAKQKISWEELVKKRKTEEYAEKQSIFSIFAEKKVVYAGFFLVLIIIAGLTAFIFLKPPAKETGVNIFRPPKPSIRESELIEINALDRKIFFQEWQKQKEKRLPYKDFRAVYLVKTTAEVKRALNPKEVFKFLEIPLPLSLQDSLGKEITLGFISILKQNEPVFILNVENYGRAFGAMLKWEATLPVDFRFFLEQEKISGLEPQIFSDIIVKNQNTRILNNKNGETIIAYAFFNKKILIISSSQEALEIALEKLL